MGGAAITRWFNPLWESLEGDASLQVGGAVVRGKEVLG